MKFSRTLAFLSIMICHAPAALALQDDKEELALWLNERAIRLAQHDAEAVGKGLNKEPGSYSITSIEDLDASEAVRRQLRGATPHGTTGPVLVKPGALPRIDDMLSSIPTRIVPDAVLADRLPLMPTNLQGTVLGKYKLLGMEPSGAIDGLRSTGLSRYYFGELGLIEFNENHYRAGGTTINAFTESMNTSVNGRPAQSTAEYSEEGRGRATLFWVTNEKAFTLTLVTGDGADITRDSERLIAIASEISD